MNIYLLIAKIALVAFFLFMFLRNNKLAWGVGLLTVTTAILLDTLLSTFSRDEMLAQLGFFFYVIVGALLAGSALWLWGVLAPRVWEPRAGLGSAKPVATIQRFEVLEAQPTGPEGEDIAYDRQMLGEQMRQLLSPDDLLDVIFDLGWPENEIVVFGQDNAQLISRIIDQADRRGQVGDLTLTVERAVTPIPKENLPRLEKLDEDSPPTILRHYLLAYYDLAGLRDLAVRAQVDWEVLGGDNKKSKTRNLLLYLRRHGQLPVFIDLLKAENDSAAGNTG